MKRFLSGAGAAILVFLAACSTYEITHVSDGFVTVDIAPTVLQDEAKREAVLEYKVAETLHRYITHRFRKLGVRKSLRIHATLDSFRLKSSRFSGGVSKMVVQVRVVENGEKLDEFSSVITTRGRDEKAVRAMSKDIARKMYDQIQSL